MTTSTTTRTSTHDEEENDDDDGDDDDGDDDDGDDALAHIALTRGLADAQLRKLVWPKLLGRLGRSVVR